MLKSKILQKIEALISKADELLVRGHENPYNNTNRPQAAALLTSCLAIVEDIVGTKSQFFSALNNIPKNQAEGALLHIIENLIQLRSYVDEGWAAGIRNLISAEIFGNFLEMADYLLGEGYKDPAAVITGSVLESHLRDLCNNYGVPISTIDPSGKPRPVKADKMNADLAKSGAYNALEQKNVTAWLDLRNKAAHGDYTAYDKTQVEGMVNGVRDFIIRNPA